VPVDLQMSVGPIDNPKISLAFAVKWRDRKGARI
jgi:hypothetical protein